MLKVSCSNAMLLMLTSVVVFGSTACSRTTTIQAAPESVSAVPVTAPTPVATPETPIANAQPPATSRADAYKLALEKADSAGNIAISAQSQDDWNLVASRWQQAIQFMRSVPSSSPYRSIVQTKLTQYRRNLMFAKKQAARAGVGEIAADTGVLPFAPRSYGTVDSNPPAAVITNASPRTNGVYIARIKRRAGGTPIIDVTFNGSRTFEMIVDTGASGTVITREMASALGLGVVGKAKVNTASEKGVEVLLTYLDSIAVGRAVVKGVVVAIGNSALDIGLLGHDFFADYDVTVKRDVVEFRQR
ncbi:MAG: TIGR02281 family clan AA aspartic protease [Stenomitos frigidus ULC029]